MSKVTLQEIEKIKYWFIKTDDGCEGHLTPWCYLAHGTPDNILKQIINEGHSCGWGFRFTPLRQAQFNFETLDLRNINYIEDVKLSLNPKISCFELSLWYEAGLNERGDETFYHYQKQLFPSFQPYLQKIDWVSSTGETSISPMRRPGTCEYKMPNSEYDNW